jgi:hypothetical protein
VKVLCNRLLPGSRLASAVGERGRDDELRHNLMGEGIKGCHSSPCKARGILAIFVKQWSQSEQMQYMTKSIVSKSIRRVADYLLFIHSEGRAVTEQWNPARAG